MLFSFAACGQSQPVEQSESKEQDNTEEIDLSDDIALMYFGKEYKPGEIIEIGDINTVTVLINGTATVMASPFELQTDSKNALGVVALDSHSLIFNTKASGFTVVTISTSTASEYFILTTKRNLTIADVEKQIADQERIDAEIREIEDLNSQFDYASAVKNFGNALSLATVIEKATAEHEKDFNQNPDYSDVKNYLLHQKNGYKITKKEIDSLTNNQTLQASVPYEGAVKDVDLFFKAMEYWYGAYYYFGKDNFEQAHDKVLAELEGKTSISGSKLAKLIIQSLDFIVDGHVYINNESLLRHNDMYRYYYCDLVLFKDDNGYYTIEDNEKWYYKSCSNSNMRIDFQLQSDGTLVYSLIQYCKPASYKEIDEVVFVNGPEEKTFKYHWVLSTDYAKPNKVDYKFLEDNGIYYVSVREFNAFHGEAELKQSVADAPKLKNAKLIIYDTRGHNGGSAYRNEWIQAWTGVKPHERIYSVGWMSYPKTFVDVGRYSGVDWGEERVTEKKDSAKVIKNNIPVIVLTDHNSASGGDGVLRIMKSIQNCIIVGSNSRGFEFTTTPREGVLPNSGIPFRVNIAMNFYDDSKSIEGQGVIPDVWCNPQTALETVMNMLIKYDVADENSMQQLLTQIGHK